MQKCQWEEQNKHEGMDSTTFGKRGHSEVYQRNSLSIFFTEEMQRVRGGERERESERGKTVRDVFSRKFSRGRFVCGSVPAFSSPTLLEGGLARGAVLW